MKSRISTGSTAPSVLSTSTASSQARTSSVQHSATFTVGSGPLLAKPAVSTSPFALKRKTVYVACKLTGADPERLASIKWIIKKLNEKFEVLTFAFDLDKGTPLGDPEKVLEHDLGHVENADFMVVIIDGDSSDGRGIEITYRVTRGSPEQVAGTLIFYVAGKPLSAMYRGFDEMFYTTTLEVSSLDEIPGLVISRFTS